MAQGEQCVGSLMLAAATSVPKIVATNAMVRRGITVMAYGNVVGSNVFNLMIFCWAPFFAAGSAGLFLQRIPLSLIYTVLAVALFSLMAFAASLMPRHEKTQRAAMAGIVILWAGSLALVF